MDDTRESKRQKIDYDKIVLDIETDGGDHILQVSYNIYDIHNNLLENKNIYIYDGVHSTPYYPTILQEDIILYGLTPKEASELIVKDLNQTRIVIGHNVKQFDLVKIKKMISEFDLEIKNSLIIHDTMLESTDIVKIKRYRGYKYPKLIELYKFLFNKEFDNQHNAIDDVNATFECYKKLCEEYHCF
jgi:DNA polymerase III epsilon subunit-like protein